MLPAYGISCLLVYRLGLVLLNSDHHRTFGVYTGDAMVVSDGAHLDDPITDAGEMQLADVYELSNQAVLEHLSLVPTDVDTKFEIAPSSDVGRRGATLHLDCCATFITQDSVTVEVMVLVETRDGEITASYIMPLSPLEIGCSYTLVKLEENQLANKLAHIATVSFTRGTRVSTAGGQLVPIELLSVGDEILTRDHGMQKIQWIGQQTVRAQGAFAPIKIDKGVLNNENDLVLGPNHRLFIYQRDDQTGAGRPEIMIKAKFLVNGDNIVQTPGGFVDYFQLLFDQHVIIYAEGIAAESLSTEAHTHPTLPDHIQKSLAPRHRQSDVARHIELDEKSLVAGNTAALLRRASMG